MSQESKERRALADEMLRVAALLQDETLSGFALAEKALPGVESLLAKAKYLPAELHEALLTAKQVLLSKRAN
jgi:hypothetical protein